MTPPCGGVRMRRWFSPNCRQCQPRGPQEPEAERHLDRQRHEVVVPPAAHSPLAPEVAGTARGLVVHLRRETDPVLRERRFVESTSRGAAAVPSHFSRLGCCPWVVLRGTQAKPVTARLVTSMTTTKPSIYQTTRRVRLIARCSRRLASARPTRQRPGSAERGSP